MACSGVSLVDLVPEVFPATEEVTTEVTVEATAEVTVEATVEPAAFAAESPTSAVPVLAQATLQPLQPLVPPGAGVSPQMLHPQMMPVTNEAGGFTILWIAGSATPGQPGTSSEGQVTGAPPLLRMCGKMAGCQLLRGHGGECLSLQALQELTANTQRLPDALAEAEAVGGSGKRPKAGRARQGSDSRASTCEHGRPRSGCKDCGSGRFCEHGRKRYRCKDCGGSSICEHKRERRVCKDCGGSGICEHGRERRGCKECGGSGICPHQRRRSDCKDCGGNGICEHGRKRYRCKDCGGSSMCEHKRERRVCKDCGGSGICEHGRERSRCGECKAASKAASKAAATVAVAAEAVAS